MESAMVIVFPRGQLSKLDKANLKKNGVIAVEADDPKAVTQLDLAEPLRLNSSRIVGDDIVRACLTALANESPDTSSGYITNTGRACHSFVKQLADAMRKENSK